MLDVALTIPFGLELAAALTGGLSGAMSAVRARYDIFGVACIAIITGLAGGIMRDILLQNYGIYAFQKPTLIIACAIAGVVVFYFGKLATYLDPIVDLLDNLSVALWAVISVSKSLSAGLDIIPSIILGTITAVGGGILRDICMNREPEAFQAGALYGSAALVGCIVYALMSQNHILDNYAALSCVVLVLGLRYASLFFGWRTKPPRDYSDVVTRAVSKPVRSVANRVRPPKGKVERDKERHGYEKLRAFWARMNGEYVAERSKDDKLAASDSQAARSSAGTAAASDPSDRIIVDREELHRIMGGEEEKPRDPFEPRSSNQATVSSACRRDGGSDTLATPRLAKREKACQTPRPFDTLSFGYTFFSRMEFIVSAACSHESQHFSMRSNICDHTSTRMGFSRSCVCSLRMTVMYS